MPTLRLAAVDDIPAISALIDASVRGLSDGYYDGEQVAASLRHLFGVDTQLIRDGSYFVIEEDGALVASGGWSARRTLYGGDQFKAAADPLLDPATEPARIRAFFVHPAFARRGLGRMLFSRCAGAAFAAGFRRFELVATRPGEPLYRALGFTALEPVIARLPDGVHADDTPVGRHGRTGVKRRCPIAGAIGQRVPARAFSYWQRTEPPRASTSACGMGKFGWTLCVGRSFGSVASRP